MKGHIEILKGKSKQENILKDRYKYDTNKCIMYHNVF